MKQWVVLSKVNGELGLACKVILYDRVDYENELANLDGYSVVLRDQDYDGWLMFSGLPEAQGPWIWLDREYVDDRIEVLGEL